MLTRKQVFTLPQFTTESGRRLTDVRIGYETYGALDPDRGNAILVCHFFSANSHAAARYETGDVLPGWWDAIIGPGKAIDTERFFVICCDTLCNINTGDGRTVTTGPASIDPETGRPFGMRFPIVTIGDFVETQRAVLDSLGVRRLHAVAGPSMGGLQTFEWAARYPERVARAMPVIATAEADAHLIAWLDVWGLPIRLDPRWNGGDYYDSDPPLAGLTEALKIVTLQANAPEWANSFFGRRWAAPDEDPATSFAHKYQIEQALTDVAALRAGTADANSLLYLAKACQLFAAGGGLQSAARTITAPVLLLTQPRDQVFDDASVAETARALSASGAPVRRVALSGKQGHLDGVLNIEQAASEIRAFLAT